MSAGSSDNIWSTSSCHFLVEGNPVVIYASRNGSPEHVLPTLNDFLETFWQERDLSGKSADTPACLAAQIIVRFGFEICEDDFSHLKVSTQFDPTVDYLYCIAGDRTISIWVPDSTYRTNPELGLKGCQPLVHPLLQTVT